MKIESILKRAKGTIVVLGTQKYHFQPEQPGGPHVAEVADEGHAERFLAIREGYRAVPSKVAAPTAPVGTSAPDAPHVLQGTGGAEQADASTDTGASAEQRKDEDTGTEQTPEPAEATAPAKKRGRPSTKAK